MMGLKQRLSLRTNFNQLRGLVPILGLRGATEYVVQNKINLHGAAVFELRLSTVRYPLRVRRGSSDPRVFRQIFIKREYSCIDDLEHVGLVIDCGANVGYSSAYFLNRFPACEVIAIEPDSGNFAMLEANVASYGKRARVIRAGVWSHAADLVMSEISYRDGREWARQVRPCHAGEKPDFKGIDIASILASSGHERISLLKMDVEGAEAMIFAEGCEACLDKVDNIVIELHDDSTFGKASQTFLEAVDGRGFKTSRNGELTVCRMN
jgi:FkbM family methyltransferase